MNLINKSDAELVSEIKSLVGQERELVTQVLRYLREIESRKLELLRGHSSLFEFCRKELGYSEYEAHTRIQAMRLVKELPHVEAKIEEGELTLTVAAQAQGAFNRENKKRKKAGAKLLSSQDKQGVLTDLLGTSTRQAERQLAEKFPDHPRPEVTKPISAELTWIGFNAPKSLMTKLERLKQRLAHQNFEGRYDLLFEKLADIALEKLPEIALNNPTEAAPDKLHAPALGAPKVTPQQRRTRYIRKDIRQQVWANGNQGCAYIDSVTGRRCGEKHGLQIDHIQEFSTGGQNEVPNLRLLCGAHNRWRSDRAHRFHQAAFSAYRNARNLIFNNLHCTGGWIELSYNHIADQPLA